MSRKGRSPRGCGNNSGRCTSPPPAASDAELSLMKSMVQQSHSVVCSLESRGRDPWQWWGYRRTWDGRPYQCSHAIQLKMMKVAADLSPEKEQTMTTLVLRQCSLYYVLIKFFLRPHSTTSSLRFLNMFKVPPRPPRSRRPCNVLIGMHCVPTTIFTWYLILVCTVWVKKIPPPTRGPDIFSFFSQTVENL